MLVPLATSGGPVRLEKFWKAVLLYHNRPNIVNKKIVGVSQAFFYRVEINNGSDINELFTHASIIYEVRKLAKLSKEYLTDVIRNILEPHHKNIILTKSNVNEFERQLHGLFVSLRVLLPRQSSAKKCLEIVVLDKDNNRATFHSASDRNEHVLAPPFPYAFELTSGGQLRITIKNFEDAESQSAQWLVDKLFYKLLKWVEEEEDDSSNVNQQSLSLINLEKYTDLYREMKEKYGQKFIHIWPENTDPLKFVYEDIAIAAYLICLWEEESPEKKPSFVDLGCGNGLLVNILNQEGFQGYGIDVRKRKIWDLYPENVRLEVRTLIPSSASLFPDVDWIIGNHSDELTPWIPVIAARSSCKTNFFVLPCCSYDFNGQKYKRIRTSVSQYNEYINYITEIGRKCGFVPKIDKLRIPSTKKICIVSTKRSYDLDDYEKIDAELTEFISARSDSKTPEDQRNWLSNFEPRQKTERVRNCTKLDRNLTEKIILCVLNKLLDQKNCLPGQKGQAWNAGGCLELCELASCVDGEDLKRLKSECGGLQTLLRNHRYIFEVCKGTVKIRVPMKYAEVSKYKSKPCWFFINHPDGCVHDAIGCAYKHV